MDWRQSLAGVDEDYLVGISNKGIVKRAYKDLEAEGEGARAATAGLDWNAPELTVQAGGETVTIQFPLGESRCSCPSRSICRHVVMAILLARQAAGDGGNGETEIEGSADREMGALDEEAAVDRNMGVPESGVPGGPQGNSPVSRSPAGEANQGGGNHNEVNQSGVNHGEASQGGANYGEVNQDGVSHGEVNQSGVSHGEVNQSGVNHGEANQGGGNHGEAIQGGVNQGGGNHDEVNQGGVSQGGANHDEGGRKPGSTGVASAGDVPSRSAGSLGQQVWQEILTQPRKPLLRALGNKGLRRMTAAMEAGNAPKVERGTVVHVRLPGQDMTVKLLSPLEYSTCTCHRKELCSHKAEAILWCQYLEKQLTSEELAGELEREPSFDLRELGNTAAQVKDCLEHLLETGLARSGTEQAQELERLAILCHNAGLPGWEGDIRALAEGYEKYLRRAAGQTMEKLAGQLQRLYGKTLQLRKLAEQALSREEKALARKEMVSAPDAAGNINSRIQALAGAFRSEYLPVGDLELTGITLEHFVTDSGYEGDTVYFLDISTGNWYTYTNARPTFYEGKRRGGYQEKVPAPWGVSLPLEGLAGVRLLLRGARCDAGGRLSSSQETRGEILGKSELTAEKLKGWYYRRYDRLFEEQIPRPGEKTVPGLVFAQAAGFEKGVFNEITQKLELPIWDQEGRQVLVELPYTKREEASIRYLERLKQKQQPCFLGRVYLEGSQIRLYPVDVLERQELEEPEEAAPAEKRPGRKAHPGKRGTGESPEGVAAGPPGIQGHRREACQALQSYLEEVSWLLQEIYQVGCATVQDSTLEAMTRAERQGAGYGMTTLSDWLRLLGEQLSRSRHRMRQQPAETMDLFCRLWLYVQLCRQRTAYDMASLTYRGI